MASELESLIREQHAEVVQRLTAIETRQEFFVKTQDEHLKWSAEKTKEIDFKVAEYDAFHTRLKTYASILGFIWLTFSGWVLHKLGMK